MTYAAAAAPGDFPETQTFETLVNGVRIAVNAPTDDDAPTGKPSPTRVLLYALPNGNTLEQTLGCQMRDGLDWHYDIQHVAAQTRRLREINPSERLVLVAAEAPGLSWPTWRGSQPHANARIGTFLGEWRTRFGGPDARVTLAAHSGGGSFIFGVIEAADDIPAYVDRIAILDANYAFDAAKHADKLVRWLRGDDARRLVVLAYDDREITFNGKKVVGPDGGTFRATGRMIEAFKPDFTMAESTAGPFTAYAGLDGRVRFYVHPNPQNKILHTALVGDMNGLLHAQTLGTPHEGTWGAFGGPRAYERWIQAEPAAAPPAPGRTVRERAIPPRPANAVGGRAFMESIAKLDREAREAAILKEIAAGNIPDFLRNFVEVPIAPPPPRPADSTQQQPRPGPPEQGGPAAAGLVGASGESARGVIHVMPDYLAVGGDRDFVRVPMNPHTAQRIAERFHCTLPTRKMVDAIDAAAEVRLVPAPLTEDRESVAAFLLAHEKIEQQRALKRLGALVTGVKKDVVLSPRIFERPDRVAIYGWRQLDGTPIQPLTTVHVDWYVDYSHGVRLVRDRMTIDNGPASVAEVLQDPARAALLSDEGPITPPRYPGE